jgi:TonB family protein
MRTLLSFACISLFFLSACQQSQAPIDTKLAPITSEGGPIGAVIGAPVSDPTDDAQDADGALGCPRGTPVTAPKKNLEKCPPLVYPNKASAAGVEGIVRFQIEISKEGKVTSAKFLERPQESVETATKEMVEAATTYLKNCEFTPAIFNDKPMAVKKIESVIFKLK